MRKLLAVIAIVVMFVSCSRNAIGPSSEQVDSASHRIYDLAEIGRIKKVIMASQTKSPTGFLSYPYPGGFEWDNESNATTSDNLRASADMNSSYINSYYLLGLGFNFTIPAGATINGVGVSVERRNSHIFAEDESVMLYVTAETGFAGDEKASSTNWPLVDTIETYGGATDDWSRTLTAENVNDYFFGVGVAVKKASGSAPCIAEIDHIEITVYYTEIPSTTVSESQNISLTGSDTTVGSTGVLVSETQNIALDASTSNMLGLGLTQSISLEAFDISGSSRENAGIRCISSGNDIHILDTNVNSLIESWKKDFQVNKYEDGHSTIYHRSAWRKTWRLLIQPNDVTRTFVTTLRTETDDINFFPTYLFDKSTFYKVRVDNRSPLYYYAGLGDAGELFQIVFYEVT